jgi:hypothetical protein
MESSTFLVLAFVFISVSVYGDGKKTETTVTEAGAVDAKKDIENKEIEDLKQKIADIVSEAFYNLTTAKENDLISIEQSDSKFEDNIATHDDNMKKSDEFAVNEDKIKVDDLNDSEETSSGLSMVYIGILCGVGGLLVLLLVGIIFFARGAKKRGTWKVERV